MMGRMIIYLKLDRIKKKSFVPLGGRKEEKRDKGGEEEKRDKGGGGEKEEQGIEGGGGLKRATEISIDNPSLTQHQQSCVRKNLETHVAQGY